MFAHAPAMAASCAAPSPIRFAAGAASAEVNGAIARGELDCWTIRARAGQAMSVKIESPETNAVFQLYRPGWRIRQQDSLTDIDGPAERGAADGDDARAWSGRVAQTGAMLVAVGTVRGGGQYRLTTAIH